MKKTFLILGMAALVMLATSCKKNEQSGTSTFSASIETDNSRTFLDGMKVKWSNGDVIKVFGEQGDQKDYTFTGLKENDPQWGYFSCGSGGVQAGSSYWGFYPASVCTGRSGDVFSFSMPSTQNYSTGNTFANTLNPMAAVSSNTVLPFKNAFSVLKVDAVGNYAITSVVLTASHALHGSFTFNRNESSLAVAPADDSQNHTLTLSCSGVTLSATATPLYFVVPPDALSDGFTLEFKNNSVVMETVQITQAMLQSASIDFSRNRLVDLAADVTVTINVVNMLPALNATNYTLNNMTVSSWGNGPMYPNTTHSGNSPMFIAVVPTSAVEAVIYPVGNYHLINGHRYYIRWNSHVNSCTNGVATSVHHDAYFPIEEPSAVNKASSYVIAHRRWHWDRNSERAVAKMDDPETLYTFAANSWQMNSSIFDRGNKATGDYGVRFDCNNGYIGIGIYAFGCPMLIDLTATYTDRGLAIPDITVLDTYKYFTGSIPLIEWVHDPHADDRP